jgi:hypothetical protein
MVPGVLTATAVFVYPQGPVVHASGVVTAVNGTAKATACGVAGTSGYFAVVNARSTASNTVEVTATTRFFEPPMKPGVVGPKGPRRSNATFASVCVGESVLARGTMVSGVLSAIAVFVFPRRKVDPPVGHTGVLASGSRH